MRWVATLVLLVGCRIGFDRSSPAADDDVVPDDARGDARVFDVPFDDTAPANCPQGYQSLGIPGSKYKGIDTSSTWAQAQAACVADGTHLAIIDGFEESMVLAMVLPTRDIWVGVTDNVTLGTWRTVTGGIATYLPWDSSEPDVDPDERCVESEFPLYQFLDQDCGAGRRFICECDGVASDPASY